MRTLSLFSGIGGLDLGLERAGFTIVAQCEQDPFCRAVLAKHWPGVPCFDDVRTIDPSNVPGVECVCGGFPCQDVSVAGKGAGVDAGERSGLWREMFRVIDALRPRWVITENVPALRTRGADRVLGDLEGIGYACWPLVVGAGDVGAPHRRQRVFVVAYAGRILRRTPGDHGDGGQAVGGEAAGVDQRCGETIMAHADQGGRRAAVGNLHGGEPDASGSGGSLAHAERDGRRAGGGVAGDEGGTRGGRGEPAGGGELADAQKREHGAGLRLHEGRGGSEQAAAHHHWPSPPGVKQHDWEAPRILELPLGGAVDGVPARLVRSANRHALRAYGNAVVPQVAEVVGRAVMAADRALRIEAGGSPSSCPRSPSKD